MALIDELAKPGVRQPGLSISEPRGETVTRNTGSASESFFGVDVEDIYSSTEAGSIAIQCPDCGDYHVMAETLIVEVLDECRARLAAPAKSAESSSPISPTSRCRSSDTTSATTPKSAEPGKCGRGLPVLAHPRPPAQPDVLPDGTRQWPLTGFYRFRDVAPVLQYQFVQIDRATIEVNLVVERPLSDARKKMLCATSFSTPSGIRST